MSKKYSVECETGAEWRCCLINEPFQALAFAMAAVNPSSATALQETEILAGRPVGCAYFNELENSSAVIRPSGIATLNGTV